MNSLRASVRKYRKEISFVYTILYAGIGIFIWFRVKPEMSVSEWINSALFYFYGIMLIWHEEKPDEMVEFLYFDKNYKNAIIEGIQQNGFKLIKETRHKILFAKGKYWIFWDRITLYKKGAQVINLKGRAKFLRHLHKYRIQYKKLGHA